VIIELTNHYVEMSAEFEVERVEEKTYGGVTYFMFYFGRGKWSKEYSTPTYSYRVLK
jgi:hypothetical protein